MPDLSEKVIMDGVTDLIFVMRVENNTEFVYEMINRAAEEMTGIGQANIGKKMSDVVGSEHADLLYPYYRQAAATGDRVSFDDTYTSSQFNYYFEIELSPLLDDHKQCNHLVTVVRNVTKHVIAQNQLKEWEERFRAIAENANDLITMVDQEGVITYASPSYRPILGYDKQEYEGRFMLHNIHPDDRNTINRKMLESIKYGYPFTATFRQFNSSNSEIWCQSHGTSVYDTNGAFRYMVIITRDVSKETAYQAELQHFAYHDSLTRLPNRRLFEKELADRLNKQWSDGSGFAVALIDIDYFKRINDEWGHDAGDAVLVQIARRLEQVTYHDDLAARLGGDEFVVLLSDITSENEAISVAKKIQYALSEPWTMNGEQIHVTASAGLTMGVEEGATVFSTLKKADNALYEAKENGRNAVRSCLSA